MSLLTFNSKYVVTSTSTFNTGLVALQDDSYASQTFSLTGNQTVLVIYAVNNHYADLHTYRGMKIGINIDATDYAQTGFSNSPSNATNQHAEHGVTFWVGTLGNGNHTIKGRIAYGGINDNDETVTIDNRILLIYILDGTEFQYIDDQSTANTTTSTSLVDDNGITKTFTPSGSCKGLYLYNVSAFIGETDESAQGRIAAINVAGTDYCQMEQSPSDSGHQCSNFCCYASALTAVSTTVKGRFASELGASQNATRHQLGVLLFADSTLLDVVNSASQTSVTSSTLATDTNAEISRTTSGELLTIVAANKLYASADTNFTGTIYGISIDGTDYIKQEGGDGSGGGGSDPICLGTCYALTVASAVHTVYGRIATPVNLDTAIVDNRVLIALWLPGATAPSPIGGIPLGFIHGR
jgi:hypothetical protein